MLSSNTVNLNAKQKSAIYILGAMNVLSAMICLISAFFVNSPQYFDQAAARLSSNTDIITAIGGIQTLTVLQTVVCIISGIIFIFFAIMVFMKKIKIFYVIRAVSAIGLLLVILLYLINPDIFFGGADERIMVGIIFGVLLYQAAELILSNTGIHIINGMT